MKRKVLVIVSLFSLSLVLFNITSTYSKYVSSAKGNIDVSIAKPVIESGISSFEVNLGEFYPGDSKEYLFDITNYKDNVVNEVGMNYIIEINNTNNLPISYELYKNDSTSNILTNNKTSINYLDYTTYQNDSYILKVTFIDDISSGNNYQYSNLVDGLFITITSEQDVS